MPYFHNRMAFLGHICALSYWKHKKQYFESLHIDGNYPSRFFQFTFDSLLCARCASCWSTVFSFSLSPHCYTWSSQIHLLRASITFLFHLGCFVNLPFGISSMTDIVALEILSSNFFDVQNLSPRFIFGLGQTYTRNRGKKIKAWVIPQGHVLGMNQIRRQPQGPQVRAARTSMSCVAWEPMVTKGG